MSDKPIWSLNAKRSELGGATKGQIYLSKIGIGFVCWFLLWLANVGNFDATVVGCLAVFITSKVCWHVNKNDWTFGWDSLADWCTDCSLHLFWLLAWWLWTGNYVGSAVIAGAWACSYPWSNE